MTYHTIKPQRQPNWMPPGETAISIARKGLAMENGRANSHAIAKGFGVGHQVYRDAVDITILHDRRDTLRPLDRARIEVAYGLLEKNMVRQASQTASDLISAYFKNGHRSRRYANSTVVHDVLMNKFRSSVNSVAAACAAGASIKPPYLPGEVVEELLTLLNRARRNIEKMTATVKDYRHEKKDTRQDRPRSARKVGGSIPSRSAHHQEGAPGQNGGGGQPKP